MKIYAQNALAGFAHGLFTAKAMEEGQTAKFSCDLIADEKTKFFELVADAGGKEKKGRQLTLQEAELAVANAAWPGKGKQVLDNLEGSKKAIREGSKHINKKTLEIYDGFEGRWYVAAKNSARPKTVGKDAQPVTADDGVIYSGCRINASFDLYAMTQTKKMGVFAALLGAQFAGHSPAFAGAAVVSSGDEFESIEDDETDI